MSKRKASTQEKQKVRKQSLEWKKAELFAFQVVSIQSFGIYLSLFANHIADQESVTFQGLEENEFTKDEIERDLLTVLNNIKICEQKGQEILQQKYPEQFADLVKQALITLNIIDGPVSWAFCDLHDLDSEKDGDLIYECWLRAYRRANEYRRELQLLSSQLVIEADSFRSGWDKRTQIAANKSGEEKIPELSKEVKALAILIKHPSWSDTKIAKEVGINRTSLYKMGNFMRVREFQKKEGKKNIPHGSKSEKTGRMEAWDEE